MSRTKPRVLAARGQAARRARWLACALVAFGAGAPFVPACSLGLDTSLLRPDASVADASLVDVSTGAPEASANDAGVDASDGAVSCTTAKDCVSDNACRVGSCAAGHCSFAVCPVIATCQSSSCVTALTTCTPPTPYAFHAGALTVTAGPVGCNGDAQACVAAAYPYAFVGTANGVVAYVVSDPAAGSPNVLPVHGLPFMPSRIAAVGSRVYFFAPVAGVGPTAYKLAVAWLDAPSDPLATNFEATSVYVSVAAPALGFVAPGPNGAVYVGNDDSTLFFPMALIAGPFTDGATVRLYPSPGVPSNAAPVATSGSRAIFARWMNDPVNPETIFSFEIAAATDNAQNAGESSILSMFGPSTQGASYASGDDGSVLFSTGRPATDDAGDALVSAARLAWIVSGANAATFDGATSLDVETYVPPVPLGTPVAGPSAWIDANTALVLAADPIDLAQTSVQIATRAPSVGLVPGRRHVVAAALPSLGLVSSHGFGYVLADDSTSTCTLHIFAPACAE